MNAPERVAALSEPTPPSVTILQLTITDPEVIAVLEEHPDGRARNEFATTCLKVGVLALKVARGQVDGDAIRRESEKLMHNLAQKLEDYRKDVERDVSENLLRYFDPKCGLFSMRVEKLVNNDGELANLMRGQVQNAQSKLAETLTAFVGENSELLQLLTPDESNKLLRGMRATMDEVMQTERAAILAQFSLDNKDSALSRLVAELKATNGDMVQEFSLDKEDSALSKLVKRVEDAHSSIKDQFTLDNDSSSLSKLYGRLQKQLEAQSASNERFQSDVRVILEGLKVRKEEAQKSTRHGLEFETAVFETIRRLASPAGDVVTDCKNAIGLIPKCKVGDCTIELGADCFAPGALIAIEAKESRSYTWKSTLAEIDEARRNRGAGVGLFVHSFKTAPDGLAPLTRHKSDVVVIWNAEDPESDAFLLAGYLVAKALCVRAAKVSSSDKASFVAIDVAIEAIRTQVDVVADLAKSANTIKTCSQKILSNTDTMLKVLQENINVLTEQFTRVKGFQQHAAN